MPQKRNNMPLKKRDKKASDKREGTVNFMGGQDPQKKKFTNNFKKDFKKKDFKRKDGDDGEEGADFKKSKFQKKEGQKRSPYQNKGKKEEEEDQTKSQMRRQKTKISDLKKKLLTNYGKLIMKKADIGLENKQVIVKESMDMINGKWEDLIYKHDGCRIV